MKRGEFNILGLVVSILVAMIVGAIAYPVFAQSKVSGKSPCISNLKQIGTAFQIYAVDHDDRFPLDAWATGTQLYFVDEKLLTCDRIKRKDKRYGYAMNLAAVGAELSRITSPTKLPVLFETDALAKDVVANLAARAMSRHGRGSSVSYADTHTKFVQDSAKL